MNEGQQVVAGPVILSEAMAMAQAGEDVLEAMVREHARLVFRVAYSVLRNHHDAEDATQETFVRVLRYGRKLGEMRDPKTWLARIAWRGAVDWRKKPPEDMLGDNGNAILVCSSANASAIQFLLGSEKSRRWAALIAELPEQLAD